MSELLLMDGVLVSRYGVVQPLPTLIHEPDNGRPCVHMAGKMPNVIAVCRVRVERLNFQPRFAADPVRVAANISTVRPGVIAARHGDTLILSAELIGPIDMKHPPRGARTAKNVLQDQRIRHHWRYTLHDVDDDTDVLLAVRTER